MTGLATLATYLTSSLHNSNSKECVPTKSIVRALDTFLKDVQEMRDTVMVPNLLRGVRVPTVVLEKPKATTEEHDGLYSNQHQSSSTALVPVGSRALIPYKGEDLRVPANGCLVSKTGLDGQAEMVDALGDAFMWYRILHAVRQVLVCDASVCDYENAGGEEVEETDALPNELRHHLQGIFVILNQLTAIAKHLSTRYKDKVNGDGKI